VKAGISSGSAPDRTTPVLSIRHSHCLLAHWHCLTRQPVPICHPNRETALPSDPVTLKRFRVLMKLYPHTMKPCRKNLRV